MLRGRSRGSVLPSTLVSVLCFPATINAHTPIKGVEGLAARILHLLTTSAHLLVLLALGLLVGKQLPLDLKTSFAVFVPGLTVALLLTATGQITMGYQPILIALALCAALPVAMEKSIPRLASRLLFLAAALAIGLDSNPEASSPGLLVQALLGMRGMVIFFTFRRCVYTSLAMRAHRARIGVRVLGSWIIAISLLVLALSMSSFPSEIYSRL